ncbi:conjugal transfer/type IV secretion protein DotA/TraY [Gulbenkiania indica]|uniref:Conjugal transfer/type IV secretion protein DotA/TraY n=1 Tax=Gulbenkiania indica TaxID=375574 RepID=A0A0K6H8D4_9NEIS|nr:DotA/TraY family protein [Gulbenkiania indica]CUA87261.1 conjugal transfer/type IV secretion protein DotA/TraY [Gulbenkiania indica]
MAAADPSMPFSPCDPSAGSCTDVSVGILQWIFGPVVEKLTQGASPDAVDASASVMASIFSVFNSGLLVVASLIVSYVAVMGVTNTANEGEAMGRNWSSLWTPVRIVAGGSVLLPSTSGFSFIQLIVLMFALWGVGFANTLFKIGTENGIINGALTATSAQMGLGSGAKPNPNYPLYDIRQFAQEYLAVAWCKRTVNAAFADFGGGTPNVSAAGTPDQTIDEGGNKKALIYQAKDRNTVTNLGGGVPLCGSVKVYNYSAPVAISAETTTSAASIFDPAKIQDNTTAMSAVRVAALNAKATAINKVMQDIEQWVGEWPATINESGWENVKSDRFNQIVNQAQSTLTASLTAQIAADTTLQQIMQKYVTDITKDGWAMAGGFYQRLGGIKEELARIYSENVAQATGPNLNTLPQGPHSSLAANSYTTVYNTIISKSLSGASYAKPTTPRAADLKSNLIPSSLDDLSIDTLGSRGDSFMSGFIQWGMERVTATMIGTDGDVDAIARIKTTGDVLALLQSTGFAADRLIHTSLSGLKAIAAAAGSVSFLGTEVDATPLADTFLQWVIYNFLNPLAEVTTWLGRLAFYFGVFLPSLPYTIFMIAVVGWLMAVLQSIIAAPLWAVMHMTPDRTFVGSQTQGYLLLLSLFIRPALIITGLFAAMMVANPVVGYISKAFWAMYHANVTSAESLGWFIEFLQWKNWLIVYGFVLLPVMYMIFGLSQTLPDTVLRWIGAGVSSMGETQATEQMRANSEKFGPSALQGGASPKNPRNDGTDRRLNDDHGGTGSLGGPRNPTGGGGGRSGGGNYPRLLSANSQGVAPQQHDAAPTTSASSGSAAPSGPTRSTAAASLNTGSQGVTGSRWGNSEDISDAEFSEVKDTAPRSKSADKGTDAVLALGSAGVISGFSADDDNGSGAINTEYDSRYSYTPPTADGSSVINHGTEQGGQPA